MISTKPAEVVLPLPLPFLRSSAQTLLSHGQPSTGNGLLYGPRGSRGSLRSGPAASSSSVGLPPPLPRFGMTTAMNSQRWNSGSRAVRDSSVIAPWPNMCVCMHRYITQIPCKIKTRLFSTHAKSRKLTCPHKLKSAKENWLTITAKSHSKTQTQRKISKRYKFIGQLNTFQRKWSHNSLCFDHMNSGTNMHIALSARFPSGGPRRCQNGLCQRFAVIACAMPIDGVEFRMVSACTGSKLSRE